MYTPSHFEQPRSDLMQVLIAANPLATLVSSSSQGLDANHIPLLLRQDGSAYGKLVGHVARANFLWKQANPTVDVLAIFHGPNCYISPNWYVTKQETGKVVPTWNYAVVHAYGSLRVIDDPSWLRAQLEELTVRHEQAMPTPWEVSDAPAEFMAALRAQLSESKSRFPVWSANGRSARINPMKTSAVSLKICEPSALTALAPWQR